MTVVLAFSVNPPAFFITSITLLFEFRVYIPGEFTSPFISTLYSSNSSFSLVGFFFNIVFSSFITLGLFSL